MTDLSVRVGELALQNPVLPASGTFAESLAEVIDFNRLGGVVTKTITQDKRCGNPVPRVCEFNGGMLNAIGIPGKGAEDFINTTVPFYQRFQPPLIVSISANTAAEFSRLAARLNDVEGISAIEANISCPNIEAHGKAFAMSAESTAQVIRALRKATQLPLWAKLTPNTSDVISVAQAAEAEGSDALVVGNTLLGMAIDIETRRPKLGNIMGGMSGPAIKPLMLRMVYQCYKQVAIPIIGCGGIANAQDVIEYLLAGATAVEVGTTSFIHPGAMMAIVDDLNRWCNERDIPHLAELTGALDDSPFPSYTALS